MEVFYNDINSILVINPKGMIRKLYTPFRVYCIANAAKVAKTANESWVYVDEVHTDSTDKILYLINGEFYPYSRFHIKIHF
jgi:hypothetical protein